MSVLIITYDLKTTGHNYTPLYEALQNQGPWAHYLASTWLIKTEKSPQQMYESLAAHITTNDSILITTIHAPYWGYLPKDAWDWLSRNLA
jgi:hypothetical protein